MKGDGSSFPRLVEIMARLLAPDGCPWDREQTLDTLRPFLVEETYEVLDALERGDVAHHREELGDLLMQVVFHAAIRQGEGAFHIDDVIAEICDKLVRRHPHIFGSGGQLGTSPQPDPGSGGPGSVEVDSRVRAGSDRSTGGGEPLTSSQVLAQWDAIKAEEKAKAAAAAGESGPPRTLAGVTRGLPALARATKLGSKAGRVGFDWGGWAGSLAKVREECDEIEEVAESGGDRERAHHEIGDLLFAVVNLARKLDIDAESALHDASGRFTERFAFIEDRLRERGRTPAESNLTEMDGLWDDAKAAGIGVSPHAAPPAPADDDAS